jgi:hypothetical protein
VREVAVEEEGLHLEGLELPHLPDAEVHPRPVAHRLQFGLAQVALVEVVGLLDQVLLLDEGGDGELLEFLVLVLLLLEAGHLAAVDRRVQLHALLLHRHHVLVDAHRRLQLLLPRRLAQLYRPRLRLVQSLLGQRLPPVPRHVGIVVVDVGAGRGVPVGWRNGRATHVSSLRLQLAQIRLLRFIAHL